MVKGKDLGTILREARQRNGYTQQELADKYIAQRQLISAYELNKIQPSVDGLLILLDILKTPVLLENGEIKPIKEIEEMGSTRDLRLEFLKFDVKELQEQRYLSVLEAKERLVSRYNRVIELAESKGLKVYRGEGFTDNMWNINSAIEGIAFSISKGNKEIQVGVNKSGEYDIFLLEDFIEDINNNYSEDIGNEIYKIITFTVDRYFKAPDIYGAFKTICDDGPEYTDYRSDVMSLITPMLEGYKDIIIKTLKEKNYFEKRIGYVDNVFDTSISYIYNIQNTIKNNALWIKLIKDGVEVYDQKDSDHFLICQGAEYAVDIFDDFDSKFEEALERNR